MAADRSRILQQAQLYASRGQHDAAIAEWKKLAMDAPNDGSIHNAIGDLYLKRNAPAEATAAFLQAAAAFRAEGATLKAIAAFKKVLKSDPTRYEVYRHLGDLNAERGLLSSAVQDYLTLGKYYLKERRGKDALEIYKKIVSQDPSNLSAQQRVAELCVQENLQDEATKVYLQLGRERSAQGRYDEAKDAYLAALRIDPKNSEAAQFVESVKNGGTGSFKAAKSGTDAPVNKPSEPLSLLAEATRRIEEKQYAGAEAILNQMLTREPGNPQVCQLLARLHLQRGDVQVALGEYRFLAGAALRAQDLLLAESLILEFLSAEPNSVPLLELYGELYKEKGDKGAAAQQYAKAVELLLGHPEPGMESLHEELFEKVQSLSTDAGLVDRLAARMRGESTAEIGKAAVSGTEPVSVEQEPPTKALSSSAAGGFSVVGAEPEPEDRHFSLKGAAPDTVSPFAKGSRSQEISLTLDNAAPDGDVFQKKPLAAGPTQSPAPAPAPIVTGQAQAAASRTPQGESKVVQVSVKSPAVEKPASPSKTAAKEPTAPLHGESIIAQTPVKPPSVDKLIPPSKLVPKVPATPPPDYEAHYTLGVSYKNMGLYEEAKEEFQVSVNSETFYLDSVLMIALSLKEEHQLAQAIRGLEMVLSDPRCQGAKGQAIRYELGLLYEAEAQWEKAANAFQSIPSFHDVPQRLEALKGKRQPSQASYRLAG
ncbi:MAG: tetratricopeptide repeat protein [Nitrospirae bacterium]|nr:tetratricopeptide repeat protein [Nitrospirota bacterium]